MVTSRTVFSSIWLILLGTYWAESHAQNYKIPSSRQVRKFGCVFQNEKYDVPTDSILNPVYGEEGDVKPMDFANVTEFLDLLKMIDEEYSKLVEELVFTNIPEFYDLYDEYKTHEEKNLTSDFYKDYVPKFFPRQICSSMAIEMLDRLTKIDPSMSESIQLITTSLTVKKELLQDLDLMGSGLLPRIREGRKAENIFSMMKSMMAFRKSFNKSKRTRSGLNREPPRYLFMHDHVAGLLRIRLEGTRLGYVLIDPGYKLDYPIVIMADTKFPHQPYTRNYLGKTKGGAMHFFLPRQDYIITNASVGNKNSPVKTYENLLYYIGKPYCSFQMSTVKAYIITHPIKVMTRYDETGFPLAYFKFDVTEEQPKFTMTLRYHNFTRRSCEIPFGTLHDIDEEKQRLYNEVIRTIDYDGNIEAILHKAEVIARDKQFLKYIKNLIRTFLKLFSNMPNENLPF